VSRIPVLGANRHDRPESGCPGIELRQRDSAVFFNGNWDFVNSGGLTPYGTSSGMATFRSGSFAFGLTRVSGQSTLSAFGDCGTPGVAYGHDFWAVLLT